MSDEKSSRVSRRETLNSLTKKVESQPNRRGVLRGAAASVVASLGFTNVAAALEPSDKRKLRRMESELNRFEEQVRNHYDTEERVRDAIQTHGHDVLNLLSEEDYIPEPAVEDLNEASIEVDAVYEDSEETFSSYLRLQTEVEDGQLGINIFPEAGLQYAVLSHSDSETVTVYDPVSETIETDATQVRACLGYNCSCTEYYVTCGRSDCWKDGATGSECCYCNNLNCDWVC